MKWMLLAVCLLACASAPRPKAPDVSRRIPVNRSEPPEVSRPGASETTAARDPGRVDYVEWR